MILLRKITLALNPGFRVMSSQGFWFTVHGFGFRPTLFCHRFGLRAIGPGFSDGAQRTNLPHVGDGWATYIQASPVTFHVDWQSTGEVRPTGGKLRDVVPYRDSLTWGVHGLKGDPDRKRRDIASILMCNALWRYVRFGNWCI